MSNGLENERRSGDHGGRGSFKLSGKQGWAVSLIGLGAMASWAYYQDNKAPPAPPAPQEQQTVASRPTTAMLSDVVSRIQGEAPQASTQAPSAGAPPVVGNTAAAETGGRMRSYKTTVPTTPPPAPQAPQEGSQVAVGGQGGGSTTVAFKGTQIPAARAGAAIDLTYMLMPGIYQCVLDVAISTDTPGPFICHTEENILSPRNVTVMKRFTRIVGTYTSDIRQGQERIPSIAATAWTPEGVPVPLGAAMADELGRVGLPGGVDNHTFRRIGGAVMLLLTQNAFNLAQTALRQGNGNTSITLGGGGGDVQGLAAEMLRGSTNIPPTITKNQGERVSFFVTAPIDFSDAYQLRLR